MEIASLHRLFLSKAKICTDTRMIEKGAIFFALKGENFNGNEFAFDALKSGCSYAVVDEQTEKNPKIIKVENVLQTLQQLALFHRKYMATPVLGITGTNGKTTTKELITKVLDKKYNVAATKGNLNNHIGVPLTLLSIEKQHNFAVIEMGANHIGEIDELCRIADPDFGLITNIGKAHLEGFGSLEGVIKTKTELYRYLDGKNGTVFYDADNIILKHQTAKFNDIKKISYGTSDNMYVSGEINEMNPYLNLIIRTKQETKKIESKLVGKYNFGNILTAACVGTYFDVGTDDIANAIKSYFPGNNRSQIVTQNNKTILLDAYNANPVSMSEAIDNFAEMYVGELKTIILGDMFELGIESQNEHKKIVEKILKQRFDTVLLAGKNFKKAAKDVSAGLIIFESTHELIEWLKQNKIHHQFVLIKGSRGMQLEKVVELL